MKILQKIKGKLTSEISLDQRFHDTGIVSDTRGHDLFSHSMARANLIKSKELVTNTKYRSIKVHT